MNVYVEREYDSKRVITPLLKPIRISQKIRVDNTPKKVDVIVHARGSDEIELVTRGLPPKILRRDEINTAAIQFEELFASCWIRYFPEASKFIQ